MWARGLKLGRRPLQARGHLQSRPMRAHGLNENLIAFGCFKGQRYKIIESLSISLRGLVVVSSLWFRT